MDLQEARCVSSLCFVLLAVLVAVVRDFFCFGERVCSVVSFSCDSPGFAMYLFVFFVFA